MQKVKGDENVSAPVLLSHQSPLKKFFFPTNIVRIKDHPKVAKKPGNTLKDFGNSKGIKPVSQSTSLVEKKALAFLETDGFKGISSQNVFNKPMVLRNIGSPRSLDIMGEIKSVKPEETFDNKSPQTREGWIVEQKKSLNMRRGNITKSSDMFLGDRNITGGTSLFEPDILAKYSSQNESRTHSKNLGHHKSFGTCSAFFNIGSPVFNNEEKYIKEQSAKTTVQILSNIRMRKHVILRKDLVEFGRALDITLEEAMAGSENIPPEELMVKLQELFKESIEIFIGIISKDCLEYGKVLRNIWESYNDLRNAWEIRLRKVLESDIVKLQGLLKDVENNISEKEKVILNFKERFDNAKRGLSNEHDNLLVVEKSHERTRAEQKQMTLKPNANSIMKRISKDGDFGLPERPLLASALSSIRSEQADFSEQKIEEMRIKSKKNLFLKGFTKDSDNLSSENKTPINPTKIKSQNKYELQFFPSISDSPNESLGIKENEEEDEVYHEKRRSVLRALEVFGKDQAVDTLDLIEKQSKIVYASMHEFHQKKATQYDINDFVEDFITDAERGDPTVIDTKEKIEDNKLTLDLINLYSTLNPPVDDEKKLISDAAIDPTERSYEPRQVFELDFIENDKDDYMESMNALKLYFSHRESDSRSNKRESNAENNCTTKDESIQSGCSSSEEEANSSDLRNIEIYVDKLQKLGLRLQINVEELRMELEERDKATKVINKKFLRQSKILEKLRASKKESDENSSQRGSSGREVNNFKRLSIVLKAKTALKSLRGVDEKVLSIAIPSDSNKFEKRPSISINTKGRKDSDSPNPFGLISMKDTIEENELLTPLTRRSNKGIITPSPKPKNINKPRNSIIPQSIQIPLSPSRKSMTTLLPSSPNLGKIGFGTTLAKEQESTKMKDNDDDSSETSIDIDLKETGSARENFLNTSFIPKSPSLGANHLDAVRLLDTLRRMPLQPKEDIPLMTILKSISAIYTHIIKSKEKKQKTFFFGALYEFKFMRSGGKKSQVELKIAQMIRCCLNFSKIPRLRMFLRLSTVNEENAFDEEMALYFDMMESLDESKASSIPGLGLSINSQESVKVPLAKAIEFLNSFVTRIPEMSIYYRREHLLNELKNMKSFDTIQISKTVVDFDSFAELLLDASKEAFEKKYKFFFSALDLDSASLIPFEILFFGLKVLNPLLEKQKAKFSFDLFANVADEERGLLLISFPKMIQLCEEQQFLSQDSLLLMVKNNNSEFASYDELVQNWEDRRNTLKLKLLRSKTFNIFAKNCLRTLDEHIEGKLNLAKETVLFRYRLLEKEAMNSATALQKN